MASLVEQEQALARRLENAAPLEAVQPLRLTLHGVTKTWAGAPEPVLDGVDFELEGGKLVSIAGRNGAGKTTLLRIVSGLIAPDRGEVMLDGLTPRKDRREYQRRLGFVSASAGALYARLSVQQHLDLWARLAFVPRAQRRSAIEVAINRFELHELLPAKRVDRLSMGQRQRLRLSLAFLHDPKLVLLDEPWNSLDEQGRDLLISALKILIARGGAAICCSPTGSEIGIHADLAYLVRDGKVVRP